MANKHLQKISDIPNIGEGLAKDEEIIEAAAALDRAEVFQKLGASPMGKEVIRALNDELTSIDRELIAAYKTAPHNEIVAIVAKKEATETLKDLFEVSDGEIDELQSELDNLIRSKAGR